ncbi:hypothetical protein EYF80_059671 [Liparis tanakae]|uniref:Uncharacterized protein n=1 Tax=Liparis tanakae TaxID=230148 RepID=A0A4Z2EN28_9TELE|nr:hypothetical protein EYF80_059671 [Liparis tanakae]
MSPVLQLFLACVDSSRRTPRGVDSSRRTPRGVDSSRRTPRGVDSSRSTRRGVVAPASPFGLAAPEGSRLQLLRLQQPLEVVLDGLLVWVRPSRGRRVRGRSVGKGRLLFVRVLREVGGGRCWAAGAGGGGVGGGVEERLGRGRLEPPRRSGGLHPPALRRLPPQRAVVSVGDDDVVLLVRHGVQQLVALSAFVHRGALQVLRAQAAHQGQAVRRPAGHLQHVAARQRGAAAALRPSWAPPPHAHTSRCADSASVCRSPQASSSTGTLSGGAASSRATGVGLGTLLRPGRPHCPEALSPHMWTPPSSVTAPLWKLPAATATTRWPPSAPSRVGVAGPGTGLCFHANSPKLYTCPPGGASQNRHAGPRRRDEAPATFQQQHAVAPAQRRLQHGAGQQQPLRGHAAWSRPRSPPPTSSSSSSTSSSSSSSSSSPELRGSNRLITPNFNPPFTLGTFSL